MASRYIIVCNYGTHDGNMVQINNMLTYDKNFYDCEKLCQRLNKSMYFEKQHCRWSSQYLSKILAANFLIFFSSIFSRHNELPFNFVDDL